MPKRILYTLLFCGLIVFPLSAQVDSALQKLLSTPGLKHAAIGISVKRVGDQKIISAYRSETALIPASVTKLFCTALSLQKVGPAYTFSTPVTYTGELANGILKGNIVIEAGGDPCLDSRYFPARRFMDTLIQAIKILGIHRIEGTVVIREQARVEIPGSWLWEDIANYYGALYHSFNYRDNLYTVTLRPERTAGMAKIISVVPSINVEFVNRVTVSDLKKEEVWIYGGPYTGKLLLKGNITAKSSSFEVKGAMHRPAETFCDELKRRLRRQGIAISDTSVSGDSVHPLHTFISPTVEEIVFYTNKRSINLFAEALGKLVSSDRFEQEVKERLAGMAIDTAGIILKDASGLSMQNAVPAEVFTDLLLWSRLHLGKSFWASLPEGGVDGGLVIYADHPVLRNNLRAKTGSFTGVRTLSGFLKTRNGQELAFTVLINHYTCTPKELQEAVRNFLVDTSKGLE
ncbi:D-alanyl-D-alanine carboxypeptidase/D-alanyl-D-alanine endopeptidase [Sanguibacteroides justesenii]|uniref:D-alanyl-D-alanine carboxypeptidase/D-alanyl-D-alanine-endopeptidase n=1 Tax=Sanguibacteroides justesenii TaxID=1547597 RepID=A0A0C3MHD2_9PORP|nr:D-alanyl-D-alanine carboxypeptidase/D-alanyl-D-alanine-endopeptidase [Sanguibacteroides justesenii]KIO45958.1 hypothetical protein BA92_05810 [Sanguibacteroides justesenii]